MSELSLRAGYLRTYGDIIAHISLVNISSGQISNYQVKYSKVDRVRMFDDLHLIFDMWDTTEHAKNLSFHFIQVNDSSAYSRDVRLEHLMYLLKYDPVSSKRF